MCDDNTCADPAKRSFLQAGFAAWVVGRLPQRGPTPPTRVLDDPGPIRGMSSFRAGGETVAAYVARLDNSQRHPVVVVIPGNFIAEEYIPNTCVALAKAGYVGIAPNIYHPIPPEIRPDDASPELKAAFGARPLGDTEIIEAAIGWPRSTAFGDPGRVAVLGFCRGGRLALLAAARVRSVRAVVAFHPAPVTADELAPVKVPVQIHHGDADQSVPSTSSESTARALRAQKTPVELFLYPGCDHGFLAYTRPFYNAEAAGLAWQRTTEFLGQQLRQ